MIENMDDFRALDPFFRVIEQGLAGFVDGAPRRGYPSMSLHRCYDLRVHNTPSTSTVVLEYSSEGEVVATGHPTATRTSP